MCFSFSPAASSLPNASLSVSTLLLPVSVSFLVILISLAAHDPAGPLAYHEILHGSEALGLSIVEPCLRRCWRRSDRRFVCRHRAGNARLVLDSTRRAVRGLGPTALPATLSRGLLCRSREPSASVESTAKARVVLACLFSPGPEPNSSV